MLECSLRTTSIEIGELENEIGHATLEYRALYDVEAAHPDNVAGAPRFSATDTTTGSGTFTYTATATQAVIHRIRWREAGQIPWSTGAWNASYETNISETSGALDAGTYEVAIQGENVGKDRSAWFDMPDVVVTGQPD